MIEAMEMKKIQFAIREEKNGTWSIYMETDEREVLCGNFQHEWQAREMAAAAQKKFDTKPKGIAEKPRRFSVSLPTRSQMQVVAMGLDPVRAAKFREQLICMNYCVHMLTDAFDQLSDFFDKLIDDSTKRHYKIAVHHIDAMLDSVYQSQIMGNDADDYTEVAKAAYALKERFEIFVSYIGKEGWRYNEIDRAFNNVTPQEWLDGERARVGLEIRQMLDRNTHEDSAKIVDKKGGRK